MSSDASCALSRAISKIAYERPAEVLSINLSEALIAQDACQLMRKQYEQTCRLTP